ncbi:MAG: AAA family ATPase [Chloroflexi bacterium]|nr:AAA family ATPase [Chloroflexota bacterium]
MSPPSARTPPRAPASDNLPLQLTRFVGRDADLLEIRDKLTQQRLVTLTGTGGVGKTRLALEVAASLRPRFEGGVYLIELASLAEPRLVAHAIAAPLGIRAEAQVPLEQSLVHALRPRHVLLVLDNCEHLIEACAHLADTLLRACPHLQLLATSRQPLRIAGEWTWRVSALPVPGAASADLPARRLLEYAGVRLFVDRASATAGFVLTDDVAAAVARVCQRLEGIPLALELAAARVPALGVAELAGRLDDALRLLVDGSRTAPARHQTLQATIDWSYGLLSSAERTLLDRLSVFAGGFMSDAAEAIASDANAELTTLTLLGRLVDRSLVSVETMRDGSVRYRLQEVVRQYGQARLARRGELEGIQARHAAFFRDFARRAETGVFGGQRANWQDRLELDLDNFRNARAWFVDRAETESALRLNAYLFLLLAYRGFASEGRAALREALDLPGGSPTMRGRALHCLALLAYLQADYAAAAEYGRQSLALRREVGDPAELAWSLLERGTTATAQTEFETAVAMLQEAREASERGGAAYVVAYSTAVLGYAESLRGNLAAAREYASHALKLSEARHFIAPTSHALATLGEISALEGDQAAAAAALQSALARASTPGEAYLVTRPMLALALIALDRRELVHAQELLSETIRESRRLGNPHRVAQCLERVALFAARSGQADPWPFVATATCIRADIASPLSPFERRLLDERLPTLDHANTSASPWSLDAACDAALALLAPVPTRQARPRLTPRETEVAELVARGLSNREIAQTLTIAERTATSHLEHVLNKLGFHSRTQIATWVTAQRKSAIRDA